MCLSFPGKIVAIDGDLASVDYGQDGIRKNINISLVKPQLGSYVIVQGGFAIRLLSEDEATEILNEWKIIQGINSDEA
ncbi:MAG TPA: HypC/HybG/HupF family hydrogenase formation chaperone [Candidatus Acidoferrales bacterium]|nr:HypC/HybG/HupF family hydrogenase formation chaperone [Candidatus Acidoferrales bacterium]